MSILVDIWRSKLSSTCGWEVQFFFDALNWHLMCPSHPSYRSDRTSTVGELWPKEGQESKHQFSKALCWVYCGLREQALLDAMHHNLLEASNLTCLQVRHLFNMDNWMCSIQGMNSPIYTWIRPLMVLGGSLIWFNALSSKISLNATSTLVHIFCTLFS